eukprot:scaffold18583_cov160-Amphora_coffeaeformis.AAC.4
MPDLIVVYGRPSVVSPHLLFRALYCAWCVWYEPLGDGLVKCKNKKYRNTVRTGQEVHKNPMLNCRQGIFFLFGEKLGTIRLIERNEAYVAQ